jgi:hypothetical protein
VAAGCVLDRRVAVREDVDEGSGEDSDEDGDEDGDVCPRCPAERVRRPARSQPPVIQL